jgi:DNA-binding NtrC family response regulator
MAEKLLIVEDEETLCDSLQRVFSNEGYAVDCVNSAEDAHKLLRDGIYDLVITDIILPGINGIELLRKINQLQPELMVIIITAYASVETAIDAMRAGAYDYVMKPIIHEEIKKIVSNALTQKTLRTENTILRKQIELTYDFEHIIGDSPAIQKVIHEIKKIVDTKSSVLLTGETGTGKELFARAIHYNSKRSQKPFIPVNCNAIPEHLLESELFGYTKGAFTGAVSAKKGLFEEADGGTIFFDEIGETSPLLQVKLLRMIEDQEIRPLGCTQSKKVDVRILTASNRNLGKEVSAGRFRDDLYYRINVLNIHLPPLRERDGDIRLLTDHFLHKYSTELGRGVKYFSEEAMKMLSSYSCPGNVRELKNIIERAVLIAEGDTLDQKHLSSSVQTKKTFRENALTNKFSIDDYIKGFINKYQKKFNEKQLADLLGITRKTLWKKRKKWNLKR